MSYVPVAVLFATAALLDLATGLGMRGFMGYSLALLALQKGMDLSAFLMSFKKYDLIAKKWPAYGKIYPALELAVGLSFLSGVALGAAAWVAIVIGIAGGISIIKAVYVEKQDLNCACVGGNSNVPLGLVSFLENAVMAGMGIWRRQCR